MTLTSHCSLHSSGPSISSFALVVSCQAVPMSLGSNSCADSWQDFDATEVSCEMFWRCGKRILFPSLLLNFYDSMIFYVVWFTVSFEPAGYLKPQTGTIFAGCPRPWHSRSFPSWVIPLDVLVHLDLWKSHGISYWSWLFGELQRCSLSCPVGHVPDCSWFPSPSGYVGYVVSVVKWLAISRPQQPQPYLGGRGIRENNGFGYGTVWPCECVISYGICMHMLWVPAWKWQYIYV